MLALNFHRLVSIFTCIPTHPPGGSSKQPTHGSQHRSHGMTPSRCPNCGFASLFLYPFLLSRMRVGVWDTSCNSSYNDAPMVIPRLFVVTLGAAHIGIGTSSRHALPHAHRGWARANEPRFRHTHLSALSESRRRAGGIPAGGRQDSRGFPPAGRRDSRRAGGIPGDSRRRAGGIPGGPAGFPADLRLWPAGGLGVFRQTGDEVLRRSAGAGIRD